MFFNVWRTTPPSTALVLKAMYPSDRDFKSDETSETLAFWCDTESLEVVNISGIWIWPITEELAIKFRDHLQKLIPVAENGNVLAQYAVAAIYMAGYCYTSSEDQLANAEHDLAEMTKWLVRAARQGYLIAVDNLISGGVGPEAERVRSIYNEVQEQGKNGQNLPNGETYRRAYGAPILESRKDWSNPQNRRKR